MINCTQLKPETVLKMLQGNTEFNKAIATAEQWSDVIACMELLKLTCTEEQINYIKKNTWDNEHREQV